MTTSNARQSIPQDPETQGTLHTGPTHVVSRSTQTRASNVARKRLVVANVTPTGYRIGKFLAGKARFAKPSDIRRNVVPGEIFTFWPQEKIAAKLGCSESTVSRGVRSLREAGVMDVRQRVRPCEASYVWVVSDQSPDQSSDQSNARPYDVSGASSGDGSGDGSHTEPRTEPRTNHVRSSSRARVVCAKCGHDFPGGYGSKCHKCNHDPSKGKPTADTQAQKPAQEPTACTCGDAYRNSYNRRCVDCKGTPSAAQLDAVEPPKATSTPPLSKTETQPPHISDEPAGPNQLIYEAEIAKWMKGRRTTA